MKKTLLSFLFLTLLATSIKAQDLRIFYNVNICPSTLVGSPSIYLYASVGVSGPGVYDEYFGGDFAGNQLPLVDGGSGLWSICVNPYTFVDAIGITVPTSATIYNIKVYFRNNSGSILTGNCANNAIVVTLPMSASPTSSDPSIVTTLRNCFVGINGLDKNKNSISLSPNPVKATSTFFTSLISSGDMEIEIFNMLGKKVNAIVAKKQSAGEHKINFDAKDYDGNPLADGYYFYSFKLNNEHIKTGKIIVAK